jgi:hypothetical protein
MDEERRDRSGNPFLRNEKKIVTYSPNQSTFIGDVDRQKKYPYQKFGKGI